MAQCLSGPERRGMLGMAIGRVRLFFSFCYESTFYPCALMEWFTRSLDVPDEETGLWVVEPEYEAGGKRTLDVIHLDSIARPVHLLPVYGYESLPEDFHFSDALDAFKARLKNGGSGILDFLKLGAFESHHNCAINFVSSTPFLSVASESIVTPSTSWIENDGQTGTPPSLGRSAQNVGVIVGAVLGVIGLVALVVVGFLLYHHRKWRFLHSMDPPSAVFPYPATTSAAMNVASEKKRRLIEGHHRHGILSRSPDIFSVLGRLEGAAENTAIMNNDLNHRIVEILQEPPRGSRVRHHIDSGWRPGTALSNVGGSSVLDVPPQYHTAI
ncbi:hypothetical protein VNI00_015123 [Paramarasmius palmivorus]|uniref:Uncharacterized protein n=1 Tax=Paramarasmius palmivorus TaxID=297713 RepID=A0AAW0BNU7_9AGAR